MLPLALARGGLGLWPRLRAFLSSTRRCRSLICPVSQSNALLEPRRRAPGAPRSLSLPALRPIRGSLKRFPLWLRRDLIPRPLGAPQLRPPRELGLSLSPHGQKQATPGPRSLWSPSHRSRQRAGPGYGAHHCVHSSRSLNLGLVLFQNARMAASRMWTLSTSPYASSTPTFPSSFLAMQNAPAPFHISRSVHRHGVLLSVDYARTLRP